MTEITVQDAIAHALKSQRGGDLASAEKIYREVLQQFPDQADALHLLGALHYQRGEFDAAISNIQRAIAIAPAEPSFRLTLGAVYQSAKQFADAIQTYEDLIARHPHIAAPHDHLGVAFSIAGRDEEAVREFRHALALDASNAGTMANLGIALCRVGEYDEAIADLRRAAALAPENYSFRTALGNALFYAGSYEDAVACCREAIELSTERGEAYATLNAALIALDQVDDAVEAGRRAVERLPALPDVRAGLGEALRKSGRLDEARAVFEEALVHFPEAARLHDAFGILLRDVGEVDRALVEFRRAMELRLEPGFHSHFLYALQFHPTMDASAVFEQHREFNRIHAEPLARNAAPHLNDPTPHRRLRVGYLTVNLRSNAVAHCMKPLLENHDRNALEIFSYVQGRGDDHKISQLKHFSDHWKSVGHLTDEKLAALIRADAIDILIDLHQHADHNRLLVFARKPAPVQISFGDNPATTGLSMMDYRLTDRHLEPADAFPAPSTETPILLPDTVCCYSPEDTSAVLTPLPALQQKHIAFGNFGDFRNVNDSVLRLWSMVLKTVEHSTLTLAAPHGAHRARVQAILGNHGIDPGRLSFAIPRPGPAGFELYENIDIVVDTFPVNGRINSLDALFMGVPVITLVGAEGTSPVSRTGWNKLANLQLADLAAFTSDEFVEITVKLAHTLPRLAEMRSTLRTRLIASPLMDAARYARNVEAAYRTAWDRWCRKQRA